MTTKPSDPMPPDSQAQLAEVVSALGSRLSIGEPPAQAVVRLVKGCDYIVRRSDEYFASARRNAEENERLTTELAKTRRALDAAFTTFPKATDVRVVMSAIIGVCEHEDGPTVIQYIGRLEKLLKEAREENERLGELQERTDGGGS
jgi:hypothetical protein